MDEKEKLKNITLSTNEIKIDQNETEEEYEQDIGQEIRVEDLEVKYEPAINIDEVEVNENESESNNDSSEPVQEESNEDANEDTHSEETVEENSTEDSNENANEEVEEHVDSEEIIEENSTEEEKEEPIAKTEENKEKTDNDPDAQLKSDKKIIKISLIIVIVLGIILLILLLTRKKEEKNVPVIKLIGDEVIVLKLDEKYDEPGYFAVDSEDGDLTNKVVVIGEVDTSKAGIYDLKYKVLDSERNRTETYRHVIVESKVHNFEFKLNGKEIVSIAANADYVEEGYEASKDGKKLGDKVKVYGEINRNKVGYYPVYYALENDGEVVVLKRFVIVYKGEEMKSDTALITDLNNWLIDEIHYSNKIDLKNVSTSVLLYFGALNCRNDSNSIPHQELISCLKKLLNLKDVNITASTKYEGKNASISYNSGSDSWDIHRLELPLPKDNLFEIIVENNNLYLYELYGYDVSISEKECDGNDYKIYYSGVDLKNIIGYESCHNDIVNENYKLVPYVHTFRVLNGKYYWVSTDMLK